MLNKTLADNNSALILCPCCSGIPFADCCEPYLQETALPPTPLALMRSRYTAYTQANVVYLMRTMRGKPAQRFNSLKTQQWTATVRWQKLVIVDSPQANESQGYVEFIAYYQFNQQTELIHERSEFICDNGRWYYIDGHAPKVAKKDACPCGSGKKAKRCCF